MNVPRRISAAIGLSLLAHVSLFLLTPRQPDFKPPGLLAQVPLTVRIERPEPQPQVPEAAPLPPPVEAPRPRPVTPPPPRPMARVSPSPVAPPMPLPVPDAPAPPPVPVAPRAPPVDMLAAIEARREARRADEVARGAPKVEGPAEDAATRNLRTLSGREGVGGVFQVLRVGPRTGEFAFNGWRPDARSQWREVIEVDAGLGGNVELAMVKRMIELVRTHYKGDFNWESHRLGRVMVLSARPEDQRELEDFLMREFFGTQVLNPRAQRMR